MEYLQTGKLKSEFLQNLLGRIEIQDERVIVGPGIGEDAAAIDMGGHYLIVKSDPITFAAHRIGWYAVNVNANDIAVMGGIPRWFLVTMLLPEHTTTPPVIEEIMADLRGACDDLGISLIGGHTEVTHGLSFPILSGTMLGEAKKEHLIRNGTIRPGDLLYMTKGVAIEGTSIIARERRDAVESRFGMDFYERCVGFLEKPGISVIDDARLARTSAGVSGMHDPTEGGVLSGAYEMAVASDVGLHLYIDRVPVFEETEKLCSFFNLSPWSLIASGALLVSVPKGEANALETAFLRQRGREDAVTMVGEFLDRGEAVCIIENGKRREVHPSGRDEITKLFD